MRLAGSRPARRAGGRAVGAVAVVAVALLATAPALADQGARFDSTSRSRGLIAGWGHSWRFGIPGFAKTTSDIAFIAFHPRMGWFVTDRLELYGEATVLLYHRPHSAISAGLGGIGGRHYLWNDREWAPYLVGGAGVLWTSLSVPEIDRIFNWQLFYGMGIRQTPRRGPGWMIEFRNHHISNAGTAGTNLGINAATVLVGVEWVLR